MEENISYYNYLVESIVNDMISLNVDLDEDASQFRNTKEYNQWFSAFTAEDVDVNIESETLCEAVVDEANTADLSEFEGFLTTCIEHIKEACDEAKEYKSLNESVEDDALVEAVRKFAADSIKESLGILEETKCGDGDCENGKDRDEDTTDPEGGDLEESEYDEYDDYGYDGDSSVHICITDEDADLDAVETAAEELGLDVEREEDEDGSFIYVHATFDELVELFDTLAELDSVYDEFDFENSIISDAEIEEELEEEELTEIKHSLKLRKAIRKAMKRRRMRKGSGLHCKPGYKWDEKKHMCVRKTPEEIARTRRERMERKNYNRKYRNLMDCDESVEETSNMVTSEMVSSIVEAAKLRQDAIMESLDYQFASNDFFSSLNESESDSVKGMIMESVSSILESSYEKIAKDCIKVADSYLNEEVIPSIVSIFENDYTKEIVSSLNENVDNYIEYVAEEVVEEMYNKKNVVKSVRSAQLESFEEELMALIESKLQIIPEREDALVEAQERIEELTERLEEASIENKRSSSRLNDAKRKLYVHENMPVDLPESMREKLMAYSEDILSESETFIEFATAFDKAVRSAREMNESYEEDDDDVFSGVNESSYEEDVIEEKKPSDNFDRFSSILSNAVRLG